jgi:ArsR family transcriptional regulator, arsenate/arsenite/antimonite-responsive transcriptional repressor
MEKHDAVTALAALAQDNRLDVFRLLVQAGPDGMAAGEVAEALDIAPNTLTFHFDRLRVAGLVAVRRDGRSMIYTARYEVMNGLLSYLSDNCCAGAPKPGARNKSKVGRAPGRSKTHVSAE